MLPIRYNSSTSNNPNPRRQSAGHLQFISPHDQLPVPQQTPPSSHLARSSLYPFPPVMPSAYFGQPLPHQHHNQLPHQHLPLQHPSHPFNAHHPPPHHRHSHSMPSTSTSSTSLSTSAVLPRGPPRKPKQSGHALWVGNLPLVTTVLDLRDMFASPEIESVFLISKSNCAFVNYSSDTAMRDALERFKHSGGILKGTKLVARMQRAPAPDRSPQDEESPLSPTADHDETDATTDPQSSLQHKPESFFIVKSLTVEDLELSVRTGIWATQAHNEQVLNDAYKNSDTVFLIFSANKSGEYFGYARMAGPIVSGATGGDDSEEQQQQGDISDTATATTTPKSDVDDSHTTSSPIESLATPASSVRHASDGSDFALDPDHPKTIYTPATATSPAGRIIDDSARGTIFWEIFSPLTSPVGEGDEPLQEATKKTTSASSSQLDLSAMAAKSTWGTSFKVEWLSTTRVPFFKTKGLKNAWNQNRDIKIARDGTELEPGVGRKLLALFRGGPAISELPMQFAPSQVHENPAFEAAAASEQQQGGEQQDEQATVPQAPIIVKSPLAIE
ncbi:YT521-B-like domain-containing protein [Myxozyma melibiosi]|uniref:YT521-B-like domain-containing protein n=1 Tax=Myxozyma melibiosi TaxID=54550 RepID=A0ABR1F0Z8_9ASCO